MTEDILVRLAAIVALGILAQWLAWRFRLPSILLLLTFGFVAGPVTGFLDPDDLFGDLLIPIVSLSVAIILFEGGLSLRIAELPHAGSVFRNLVTVGAVVTWVIAATAAHLVAGLDFRVAVLLGAILIVTGPTVIGPLLEHVRPTGRVGPILKWEGIVIDPIGAMLAVLVFEAIIVGELEHAASEAVVGILLTLGVGSAIGALGAGALVLPLRRYWLPDQLQNPVTLAVLVAAHTGANAIQSESGLFAAVVMGLVLANQRIVNVRHIVEFKENLRVLILASLFIVLAARLRLDDIEEVGLASVAFLAILIFAARPIAVALSSIRSPLDWRDRVFLAWMAPRGIVAAAIASIFALRLEEEGLPDAERLVPLAFVVIVGTIAIYGLTASPLARRLQLAVQNPQGALIVGAQPWARQIAALLQGEGFRVLLVDSNRRNIAESKLAGLPAYYGSILAEYALDEMDLTGIGRLLAMTPNDEVNALAVQRLADVFGRADLYQLAPGGEKEKERESIAGQLTGRILFGSDATYSHLQSRFTAGAVVKATNLTEEFDFDAFQRRYGGEATPLFLISESRQLAVFSADSRPTPRPGQTLISLLQPVEEEPPKARQATSPQKDSR